MRKSLTIEIMEGQVLGGRGGIQGTAVIAESVIAECMEEITEITVQKAAGVEIVEITVGMKGIRPGEEINHQDYRGEYLADHQ